MKILHVVAAEEHRGAELFASALVGALAAQGVDQRVAVLHSSGRGAISFGAPAVHLRHRDASPTRIPLDPSRIAALRGVLRSFHPTVVQAHGGEALSYAIPAAFGLPVGVVYRRIGLAPPWLLRGPKRSMQRALMLRAKQVIAVADAIRREALEHFRLEASRVVTIPNAVDRHRVRPARSRWQARESLGIPSDALAFLSLGALVWEKDPLTHVTVGRRVVEAVPGAHHLIVGDGPMRGDVEHEVRATGLQDRVHVLGARTDVGDLFAASDALLFASRPGGMEGMPAQVIEAGMAGIPTVGYAVAGVPEVVVHGETGRLTRPGDIGGLSRALAELLSDEGLRRAMGAAAAERCRRLFDIEVVAPRYLDVYEQVATA